MLQDVKIQNYLTPPKTNFSLRTDDIIGAQPSPGNVKYLSKEKLINYMMSETPQVTLTPEKSSMDAYVENPKYYHRKDKTEIHRLGIFNIPDHKLLDTRLNYRQIGFSRNLATFDITGAIPNSIKSQAVKNKEKFIFYKSLRTPNVRGTGQEFQPKKELSGMLNYGENTGAGINA